MRKYNFNPGPATLPLSVLEKVQREFIDYQGSGMSVMEISHRGKEFDAILAQTKADLRQLMQIPDNYEILFLGGGASLQFVMVPMNFLGQGQKADYLCTGVWSQKAIQEAKRFGEVLIAGSSEAENFRRIPRPDELKFNPQAQYVHLTSNNTIYGTEWPYVPQTGSVPLIADMSSDIMSRRIDVSRFALIYAGVQKNLGPAGVTLVIIRKDLLQRPAGHVPTMLQYKVHAEENSTYNTPPVFIIYVMSEMLRWAKEIGGVAEIERRNEKKQALVYQTIDTYPDFYRGNVDQGSRSWMNATFRLPSESLEKKFVEDSSKANLHGLKGHRSAGGLRVSMYNALPVEAIEKLAEFMHDFVKRNGKVTS